MSAYIPSLLPRWYLPLGEQPHHGEGEAQFTLRVLGMWATFVVSAEMDKVSVRRRRRET